jgi:APA family basic amino acid/polyamine antiporter
VSTRSNPLGSAPNRPGTFSRQATGLVRQASLWDVLIFNVNMQNVAIGVVFALLLIPPFYPGANIYLSILFAFIISLPISYVYAELSAVFPRSGGDYVYVSRIVHPAIGFMSNFSYCVWGVFYIGVSGVFLGIYGIAPLLRVLGAYTGSRSLADAGNWFGQPTGNFVMAVGLLVLFVIIFALGGMRLYFRIQMFNFVIATLGLAAIVVYGFLASRGAAFANLDQGVRAIGGEPLSSLASGAATGSSFSLKETLYASIWPWLAFNSAIYSTYMGGEVKRAARNQVFGIMGALTWAAAWTLVLTWAMLHLFGNTFFANLGNADPTQFGLSTTPTFGELTALGVGNALLGLFIMIGFTLWTYVWIAPYTVLVTRSLLAWSLDRLIPAKLAEVSTRANAPVNALLVILVLGIVSSAFYAFGNLSVLSGTVGLTASMIVVAIAGVLLPYRRPQVWRSSPVYGRIAGIPTIAFAGLVALPFLALIEWALLADVNSGTSIEGSPGILTFVLTLFVVGLPIYYVVRALQRRRGVDVDLAYKEIPPE